MLDRISNYPTPIAGAYQAMEERDEPLATATHALLVAERTAAWLATIAWSEYRHEGRPHEVVEKQLAYLRTGKGPSFGGWIHLLHTTLKHRPSGILQVGLIDAISPKGLEATARFVAAWKAVKDLVEQGLRVRVEAVERLLRTREGPPVSPIAFLEALVEVRNKLAHPVASGFPTRDRHALDALNRWLRPAIDAFLRSEPVRKALEDHRWAKPLDNKATHVGGAWEVRFKYDTPHLFPVLRVRSAYPRPPVPCLVRAGPPDEVLFDFEFEPSHYPDPWPEPWPEPADTRSAERTVSLLRYEAATETAAVEGVSSAELAHLAALRERLDLTDADVAALHARYGIPDADDDDGDDPAEAEGSEEGSEPVDADVEPGTPVVSYQAAVVDGPARAEPWRIYDPTSERRLQDLVAHVLKIEAPIHEFLLTRRVLDAFGGEKVTSKAIKQMHAVIARSSPRPSVRGRFVWRHDQDPLRWSTIRDCQGRWLAVVPPEEIAVGVLRLLERLGPSPERVLVHHTARLFGVRKVGKHVRGAVLTGIRLLAERRRLTQRDDGVLELAARPSPATPQWYEVGEGRDFRNHRVLAWRVDDGPAIPCATANHQVLTGVVEWLVRDREWSMPTDGTIPWMSASADAFAVKLPLAGGFADGALTTTLAALRAKHMVDLALGPGHRVAVLIAAQRDPDADPDDTLV